MASSVPYNPDPTVSPQYAPTPSGHNQPPPGAFGGLTAVALEHMGSAINQAGNELFERANALQLMDQTAKADEGASAFQMDRAKGHADFLGLQGKAAGDNLDSYLQSIEDSRQKYRESLTSPYAQMQYDRDTRRTQGVLMDSAARHAAEQQKAYVHGSLKAKSDIANITALNLPEDETNFKASLDEKDKIADQLLDNQAFPGGKDQRDAWAMQQKSSLASNRVEGIAKTDPFVAGRLLDNYSANKIIVGKDLTDTASKVFDAQRSIGSRIVANEVLSGGGSVAGSNPLPMSIAATTVGQYLSKDNYDLIGRAHDGSGQALGRYGVPAEKLSAWLKEAEMPDMSPGDFLKSHSAQDQLFSVRFGKLQDVAGSFNDAMKKWLGQDTTELKGSGTVEQKQFFSFLKSRGYSDDAAHAWVATLSGESGSHLNPMANQKAGGRNWENRFEVSDPSNGIANWDNARSKDLDNWAKGQGLNPNDRLTQFKFFDYEARQMGFDPKETGDSRALTMKYTGSSDSGQGYEKPLVNNGSDRWARYSGQRYAQDPVIQQTNGLIARNTPLSDLIEQGNRRASELAPNNPLFAVYLSDRITGMYRQQAFQQKQAEDQNRYIVEGAIITPDKDGRVPSTVEELQQKLQQVGPEAAQAFDNASPKDKLRFQASLANNLVSGGFKFTEDTFQQYTKLHSAAVDPSATPQQRQELLDTSISDLNIPMKYRQQLFKDQQSVFKQEETSPQMGRALRVLGPTLNAIGLDKKDKDNYNLFVSQLHDAIQEHNRDSTRPITDEDIKTIGTQLLREQPQSWGDWALSLGSSAQRWYQLPVPAVYNDNARADPRWAKMGIDPTNEMIRSMYIQQQFQQFYAKQQASK